MNWQQQKARMLEPPSAFEKNKNTVQKKMHIDTIKTEIIAKMIIPIVHHQIITLITENSDQTIIIRDHVSTTIPTATIIMEIKLRVMGINSIVRIITRITARIIVVTIITVDNRNSIIIRNSKINFIINNNHTLNNNNNINSNNNNFIPIEEIFLVSARIVQTNIINTFTT